MKPGLKPLILQARKLRYLLFHQKKLASLGAMTDAVRLYSKIEELLTAMQLLEKQWIDDNLTNVKYNQQTLRNIKHDCAHLNQEIEILFEHEQGMLKREMIELHLEQFLANNH